jgi:thioredoxin-like negative regulator of GroEL
LQVSNGDAAKGAELLGKAHELAPERPDISYRYAVALQKKGDPAKAKAVLQSALATTVSFSERKQAEDLLKQLGGL